MVKLVKVVDASVFYIDLCTLGKVWRNIPKQATHKILDRPLQLLKRIFSWQGVVVATEGIISKNRFTINWT